MLVSLRLFSGRDNCSKSGRLDMGPFDGSH